MGIESDTNAVDGARNQQRQQPSDDSLIATHTLGDALRDLISVEHRERVQYWKEFVQAVRQCCPDALFSIPDGQEDRAGDIGACTGARITLNSETVKLRVIIYSWPPRKPSFRYAMEWGWNPGGFRWFDNTEMTPAEAIPKLLDYRHSYPGLGIIQTQFPGEGWYWDGLRAREATKQVDGAAGGG